MAGEGRRSSTPYIPVIPFFFLLFSLSLSLSLSSGIGKDERREQ
jgi:hypothetical protein